MCNGIKIDLAGNETPCPRERGDYTIGCITDDGLVAVADFGRDTDDSPVRVTVREMVGERGLDERRRASMRRLAVRAVGGSGSRMLREWYDGCQTYATYEVAA